MKIGDIAGENNSQVQVDVFVTNARGSEIASKLTGYFVIKDQEFKFAAIAFGRIGGHNISLNISRRTLEKIRKIGIDPEVLQVDIQRKLIEGDVTLPQGLKIPK